VNDQAHNLRKGTVVPEAVLPPPLPAVAITGGKGGVGKTCIAVNLALMLARLGRKPLLVDCDLSLANADVMLGLNPTTTLYEVLTGAAPLAGAIVEGPNGMGFLPAASGREELTRLSQSQLDLLTRGLGLIGKGYDLLVIDTPAGIGREVMTLLRASRMVLVVVTPDPTSLADAYALIKVLETSDPGRDLRVVINQAANQDEAVQTFTRLRQVVATYLHRDLVLAGSLPRDRAVADAVRSRKPFALGPDGIAVQAIRALAMRMKAERWQP
jgi:flagellar biosynthesis protein FlhG